MAARGATPRDTLAELAESRPLAHPLPFQIRYRNHDYPSPPHLRELMGSVFRAMSDRYPNAPQNVMRLYPREHGKSVTGDEDIPAWAALRDPNIRILIMSETAGQAKDKLRATRNIIADLAPKMGRSIEQDSAYSLKLERDENYDVPTIRAAGFDSGVTGGHYDLLIFDDIVSWKTQRTEARRRKAWRQFSDYSMNLGSEGESVNLVLGTRKHPEDIYGRLIDSVGWDTRVEPAISDWSLVENREFTVVTEDGTEYDPSELGEINTDRETVTSVIPHRDVDVLWSERWSLEKLLMQYVSAMGSQGEGTLIWKRENQNDAKALQGQVLGADMLFYADEVPKKGDLQWIAGVDLGVEEDPEKAARNDTDYWSVAVGAHDYDTGITYLRGVWRKRGMTLQKGIRWVQGKLQPFPPDGGWMARVNVESNQAQKWFVQTARDEGLDFDQSSSSGSKEERIIDMSSRFESGKVRLVEAEDKKVNRWQSFEAEWAAFPTGNHDDQLDAVEILLRAVGDEHITQSNYGMGDLPT